MYYNNKDKTYIRENETFTVEGVQYPPNWLYLSSDEEKEQLGLNKVIVVGAPEDDRFYFTTQTLEDGVLTYVNMPKNLDNLKTNFTNEINTIAYSKLLSSDWMVTKSIEEGTSISVEWSEYRSVVRDVARQTKTSIENAENVETIKYILMNIEWPKSPAEKEGVLP